MTRPIIYADVMGHHRDLERMNKYLQEHSDEGDKAEIQVLHDKLNEYVCKLYKKRAC